MVKIEASGFCLGNLNDDRRHFTQSRSRAYELSTLAGRLVLKLVVGMVARFGAGNFYGN